MTKSAAKNGANLVPRIINHMNKDHVHNIEDFLVIYGHVDPSIAERRPAMEDLELGAMTLSYIDMQGTKCHVRIPIEPTLENFSDSRSKLVEMSQVAARKRGFSEYLINDIPFFNSVKDYVCVTLFFALYYFALKPHVLAYLVNEVFEVSPNVAKYILDYHVTIFRGILIIHSLEAIVILYPLLRKFRMGTLKKFACLLSTLIEGIVFLSAFKETIDRAQNPNRNKEK
ncbi:hypothetical protein C6P40_001906 [Pichia californica]|uniref:DUF2470 domain-containing protein n=1 Tax=Pichia californica TaxID=460514 RepID=A0A9P6WR86_9ASCO|nr:hypothetical protein C6P42_003200 [[Candida] californica]KAG0690683.1 hypothetical protein C6P40_001906 [[Candida] californica]